MRSKSKLIFLNIILIVCLYQTIGYIIQFLEQPVYVSDKYHITTGNLWIMLPFMVVSIVLLTYDVVVIYNIFKRK